jgi:hypothetical protein
VCPSRLSSQGRRGSFYDSGDSALAITGGTGEFAGAQGEMALSAYGTKGDAYTFMYKVK